MRLTFSTQKEAQAEADRIYAAVSEHLEPGTVRWAIPYQDMDENGKPIGANWYVAVDDRVRSVLTQAQQLTVPEWKAQIDSVAITK